MLAKVRIINKEHPHYGEIGYYNGESIELFGRVKYKVELIACQHGEKACFADASAIGLIDILQEK